MFPSAAHIVISESGGMEIAGSLGVRTIGPNSRLPKNKLPGS